MGLNVHQDNGFKQAYFLRVAECGNLCEIEANVHLMVQLKESLERFPRSTLDQVLMRTFSLMGLYRDIPTRNMFHFQLYHNNKSGVF